MKRSKRRFEMIALRMTAMNAKKSLVFIRRSGELVAQAVHRPDVLGLARIGLDLVAQVFHMRVDRPVVPLKIEALDAVDQLLPRKHPAGIFGKSDEYLELGGCEHDMLSVFDDLVVAHVDPEPAAVEAFYFFSALRGAPQVGLDPR